ILTLLFVAQRWGTARMGKMFGPITLLWFMAISILGAAEILRSPGIVLAGNPWYAARFVVADPHRAFTVLGAVVLAVTGAEALYADMGHFGRRGRIRRRGSGEARRYWRAWTRRCSWPA